MKMRVIKIPFSPAQRDLILANDAAFKQKSRLNMIFPFDPIELYWQNSFGEDSDDPGDEGYFYVFG
jgi:hypothetical protein